MTIETQTNDSSFQTFWDELIWRGLIHVSTDEKELSNALNSTQVTFYCGFDPTASSLHLGNLVQLLFMRRLQLAGHTPLALVGGSTGLIGDPRPTAERTMNSKETVGNWVDSLQEQISRFLDFNDATANRAVMVNNLDWTQNLNVLDFLRDVGKHFRVSTMLKKDAVKNRLESEAGISFTEFSYQLLQGFDFLNLLRDKGCTLQTGGSDQWGNLVSGIDLIGRTEPDAKVHAIGTPLIMNSDGTKFGKSEGNAIWLNQEMTSPFSFHQFWLNTADADVIDRLKVFTFLDRAEIERLEKATKEFPFKREAQKVLAHEVTALVHGLEATEGVEAAAEALFGRGDILSLDATTLKDAVKELSAVEAKPAESIEVILVRAGLAESLSDARRTIKQGGASVNGVKVTAGDTLASEFPAVGSILIVRKGKKNMVAVTVTR